MSQYREQAIYAVHSLMRCIAKVGTPSLINVSGEAQRLPFPTRDFNLDTSGHLARFSRLPKQVIISTTCLGGHGRQLDLCGTHHFVPGNSDFPAAMLASSAPLRLYCVDTPSIRCVELMFLTSVIW